MNKQKINTLFNYLIVALFFFLVGMLCSPGGKPAKTVKSALSYTKKSAQQLFDDWNKEELFLTGNQGREISLEQFSEQNDTYIIYFWATWCPHCMKIQDEVMSLHNAGVPLIAMPFETEESAYREYRKQANPFWSDLMKQGDNGVFGFCERKAEFKIPLIPSFWVIQNNKIKKIYIGKNGIKKLKRKL